MKNHKTALITGASAGIGLAFAKELAQKSFNLVLCARRKDILEKIADELKSKHSIEVLVIATDLAKLSSCDKIIAILAEQKINIDFLINNAGYGLNKSFLTCSWQELEDYINVMAVSVSKLCHLLLPYMKKQNYGRIINVSSIAAFAPSEKGSLYKGIKSYVVELSRALSKENQAYDINITALCPGFTYTEFHDMMGNRDKMNKLPKLLWMTAETVAKQGLFAVEHNKSIYINGIVNKIIVFLCYLLPETVLEKMRPKNLKDRHIV